MGYVPGFPPLGRHYDTLAPRTTRCLTSPRISAPGQALRLDAHLVCWPCHEPSQDFRPWAGIATRIGLVVPPLLKSQDFRPWAGIATGAVIKQVDLHVLSQDFCPWAGIATCWCPLSRPSSSGQSQDFCLWAGIATAQEQAGKRNSKLSQDFCPWAGIATTAEIVACCPPSERPRISAPGQALRRAGQETRDPGLLSQDFCPWAGIATRCSHGRTPAQSSRPRISAPGQALRHVCSHRNERNTIVPGFLPLGRHCDPRKDWR